MKNILAANDPFGPVTPPQALAPYGAGASGIPVFISILLKTLIMIAAIYAIFNFVIAGYGYISGGGDPKRIQNATEKIWQSVLGLVVAAGAFVIGGVVGQLLFGDANAILQITLFTP
jgi:hypothetical protein